MRPYRIRLVKSGILVGTMMGVVFGVLAGCGVEGGLLAMRDQAEQVHAQIEADRAALLASAGALPPGDPGRSRIEALAAERAGQAGATASAIERLDALLASAEAGDGAGTIEGGVGAVLPFLPAGAQLPVLLAGGLAASLWRATRLKQSAVSIAEGLEKAMRDDDQLREGVKRNAGVLRAVQTPTAKRIVDEVTKDKAMVRLPV